MITPSEEHAEIRSTILKQLKGRLHGASICPSEPARAIYAAGEWRDKMGLIREVASEMVTAGELEMTQKGQIVDPQHHKGPMRLRLALECPSA